MLVTACGVAAVAALVIANRPQRSLVKHGGGGHAGRARPTPARRRTADCFADPKSRGTAAIEACGYPGADDTGPEAQVQLTEVNEPENTIVTLAGSERLEDKRIVGRKLKVEVADGSSGVRVVNDEIITTGTCSYLYREGCSWSALDIDAGAKNTFISHVRTGGSEEAGENAVEECLRSYTTEGLRIDSSAFVHCDGVKLDGGGVFEDNYCPENIELYEEHEECVSDDQLKGVPYTDQKLVLRHNTLFNPHYQTAVVFLQGYSEKVGEVHIEDNFLAGGGRVIYAGEEAGGEVVGPVVVRRNRFARACPGHDGQVQAPGGHLLCKGQHAVVNAEVVAHATGGSKLLTGVTPVGGKGVLWPAAEVVGEQLPGCPRPGFGECTVVARLTGEYRRGDVVIELSRTIRGSGAKEVRLRGYNGELWDVDGGGFYPLGGSYGWLTYAPRRLTWSGNYWDDSLARVPGPE